MSATKETLCTSCGHNQICSKAREFMEVQKAVDDLTIKVNKDGVMFVRDFEWLHISVQCSHRIPTIQVREQRGL